MNRLYDAFIQFKNSFHKHLTMAIFFFLPTKITNVFVSLSIVSMILQLRETDLHSDTDLMNRIEKLLKIHLHEGILLLPEKTISWYWTPQILGSQMWVDGRATTLRELLVDNQSFLKHRSLVMNKLLECLPKVLRIKLRLDKTKNRIAIKHNIVSALNFS